ncbi:MAG TPA: aspartate-semialdehyde dehydrogenase [Anaerolineales bacterium]|nr:aspartate-semialdehyde dehydrogenase [Anaerolineales bacterium]HLB46051.1 aspartate-semialdehyde dehydrogenase [Anaerolineales bacterium]
MPRIKVAVLAATGAVGQRFVQLLDNHPWFEVTALTGSDRTTGQTYVEGCRWILPGPMPEYAKNMKVAPTEPGMDAAICFSALPTEQAKELEPGFAQAGHFIASNASAHRMWPDVPLLIPEVNPDHTSLIKAQQQKRGWSGFLTTNPNCTATGFTIALRPIFDAFGIQKIFVVSMQAISGAGYPGVASLDIVDNVVPYIGNEEDKVETEPQKMLGKFAGDKIEIAGFRTTAHTNRVPVIDGHTVVASLELGTKASAAEVARVMAEFKGPEIIRTLPSSPKVIIEVKTEADRPQPRKDRDAGNGMTTVVGRIRPDPLFDIKFVTLSHNTVRGAAGGSVQNAELMVAQGLVK